MELEFDPATNSLKGTASIDYVNNTGGPLATLRFRLEPNLNPKQSLEILAAKDDTDAPLQWQYRPLRFANWSSAKGAVEVTLAKPLAPSQKTVVKLNFCSSGNHLNEALLMLQDDPYPSLDAWYPKAMAADHDNWSIDDDRLANYAVNLRLPARFTVASTGAAEVRKSDDDWQRLQFNAEQVRGFTIFASSNWKRHERKTPHVALGICLPPEAELWSDRILGTAADAIAFYEKEYAPFPSTHLDIACVGNLGDRAHGSSAAWNVFTLFLGGSLEEQYRFLVAHEIAHQYFSCKVGSPRDSIGWMPVGLGLMMDEHYSTARGFDATFGRKMMRDFYFQAEKMKFDTTLSQSVQGPLKSPPPWSFGWNMSLAHGKAYAVCALLRDLLGPEKFQSVMQQLLRQSSNKLLRDADLVSACETALSEDLKWFSADWIDGRATLDYAIHSVNKSGDGWDVIVAKIGTAGFPVLVEVTTESGQKMRQRVDRNKQTDTLHFATQSAVIAARIDPDGVYPDLNDKDNIWSRSDR